MSGGSFNYIGLSIADNVFEGNLYCDYDLSSKEHETNRKEAKNIDPMEDILVSECVYDMACLLKSLEWYRSGDTGEDMYKRDLEYFKRKWLLPQNEDALYQRFKEDLNNELKKLSDKLSSAYGIDLGSEEINLTELGME